MFAACLRASQPRRLALRDFTEDDGFEHVAVEFRVQPHERGHEERVDEGCRRGIAAVLHDLLSVNR
jgi:hypothetical protein